VVLEKDGEVSWSDHVKNEELEERRRKELPIFNLEKGRRAGLACKTTY
jgi:hypothetical protein